MLEVQRRLLATPAEIADTAAAAPASSAARGGAVALGAGLVLVPVLAFGLYWLNGTPGMPSAPHALRQEVAARDEKLLAALRSRLVQMDPGTDGARQGWVLLGNAERSRGNLVAAAEAYGRALAGRFDPDLVGQLAQVLLEEDKVEEAARLLAAALPRAPGHVGLRFLTGLAEARAGRPEVARSTWRALVADAPPDAPWRMMVERRLADLP